MATVKKETFEKIYVKETDVPLTKTRKALIKLFLLGKGFESYSDKECKVVQCQKGRNRSITELHQLVRTRFPLTSFDAILKISHECIEENIGIVMVYCATIKKVVLMYTTSNTKMQMISDYSRKNYYETKGVDGSSLKQYEERMLQIKKEYNNN